MALIKCSECGSTVSNRATVCPQCGCPINDSSTALQAVVNNSRNKILIILFVSLGILLVGLVGWKVSNAIGKDNIVEIGKAIQGCEELFSFHNGLSCVKQNGKYGFIDKKAWISISNRVLYSDEIYYLDFIENNLGLELHNITTLDLCLDMSNDIARLIRKLIRNPQITTLLNGKRITNRKEDRPEITYTFSGNMDKDKYLTVNIKQKKAIKDKSKGSTLIAYNKKAEIINSSDKTYINNYYNNPAKLHRLEVHLNNEEIKDYIAKTRYELSFYSLADEKFLAKLFGYTLNSLIRFEKDGKAIDWTDLLSEGYNNHPCQRQFSRVTNSNTEKNILKKRSSKKQYSEN